jgi:hypothetical protein
MKFHICISFENLSRIFKFRQILMRITGTLGEDVCTYVYILTSRLILLRMKTAADRIFRQNQIAQLEFRNFFPKNQIAQLKFRNFFPKNPIAQLKFRNFFSEKSNRTIKVQKLFPEKSNRTIKVQKLFSRKIKSHN